MGAAAKAKMRVEHVAARPRGWKVRTVVQGTHRARIAFPPGRRKKGSGKLIEILHPSGENPTARRCVNPGELVIFGNPRRGRRKKNSGSPFGAGVRDAKAGKPAKPPADAKAAALYQRGYRLGGGGLKIVKAANPKRARSRAASQAPAKHRRRRMKRHNPEGAAELHQGVKLFNVFHGRDAEQVIEKQRSAAMRETYVALGSLEYLKVRAPSGDLEQLDFEGDGVKLASSPEGNQFYFIGGNQNLGPLLEKLVEDPTKDVLDLGDVVEIQYSARKVHTNFEPTSWYHSFGEENGDTPRLLYDKLKKEMALAGGSYRIDLSVDVSPGIEN